jgi:hypothetical protein
MTTRVYLHVGAPKSGTTFLQGVLESNRATLADAGVLVVGERHLDRIHAALQIREDPRLADLPESARHAWDTLVRQIREWQGESAVLSYELLAAASSQQAGRALADLAAYDVHVVITARDLGRSAVSAWQERLKFGLTTPLEKWVPKGEDDQGEWGWHDAARRPRPRRHRTPPGRPGGPALAPLRRGLRPGGSVGRPRGGARERVTRGRPGRAAPTRQPGTRRRDPRQPTTFDLDP